MELVLGAAEKASYDQQRYPAARGAACHAPSNAMYLGIGGMVTSCCVNRSHLIGRYPAQSLEQAWFGDLRRQLEAAIAADDFSKGCQVCFHAIRSGNYAGLSASVYDRLQPPTMGYPRKIDFELSNKCNLECIMCRGERSSAIRRNREQLPPIDMPYDAEFIRQLDAFIPHLEDAHFLGGEPFMIPIYLEIWERMVALNPAVEISVQTNATLITDRVKRILETMRFAIAVSIDAIDPVLFGQIRVNGNLAEVIDNIDYLRAYCARKGTSMSLSYTPMTRNWHELADVVRWCNARQLHLFFNTLSYPRNLALKELPADKLAQIIDSLATEILPAGNAVESANRQAFQNMLQLIRYWQQEALHKPHAAGHRMADDLDAYFALFLDHLRQNNDGSDPTAIYADIRSKLERLLTRVEGMGKYEALRDYVLTVEFAKLLRYVQGASDAELFAAMQGILMD